MTPLLRVSDERVGDISMVVVDGEIDASNVRDLGDRLRTALTNRSLALIVDLGAIGYIDSAGINLLFEVGHELSQRRQQLHVVVPTDAPVARMLAIVGLDALAATHDTRAAALAAAAVG